MAMTTVSAVAAPASKALAKLFADERAFVWREDPLTATGDGVRDYDDRLPSVTPAAQARRLKADEAFVKRLHAIKRTRLSHQEQVSYDLFAFMVSSRVSLARHKEWRIPFNSDSGFFADLLQLHSLVDPQTVKQYDDYVARLNDVPRYFDENIANLRQGMRDGFTLPSAILEGVSRVVDSAQYNDAEKMPFWRPFASFPEGVSERDRARLKAAGRAALEKSVIPAYAAFKTFFETEYRPAARKTIGATALPGGREYYADLVRYFTTLPDATAEGIHRTGLAEVKRIRAEMEAIVREVKYRGSFADFIDYLRTDSQFYAKTPGELMREASFIAKEIDGKLPEYFGKLPRMPYGVKPVPDAIAPNYTAGRYNPGPMGAAGEYWVNTYALETRPLYVLPALTLHEAVPGHHLQGSIARELGAVPAFRLNFYPHAFGEGWALYGEKLGEEMGVYHTPYQRFGRLTYEMWRACRLVVDTGMHAMDWTRDQALTYLGENTALSKHEIRTEVDRYISWPGQALAYKIGELKIVELRARAKAALGDKFDLRAYHDAVLESGGVTLPVLERRVDAYIAEAGSARGKRLKRVAR
ncbi:MAG: DUF885 domain-containing protein [Alphaproteobacteria bacterium]|nr:DUF885 domain-containing protein [Alphaproteobacteria bacterium]